MFETNILAHCVKNLNGRI